MLCLKCGKECYVVSKYLKGVSNCCEADIDFLHELAQSRHEKTYSEKTLRDEIAIEAMKILLEEEVKPKLVTRDHQVQSKGYEMEKMADYCYSLSDAFMARRNK